MDYFHKVKTIIDAKLIAVTDKDTGNQLGIMRRIMEDLWLEVNFSKLFREVVDDISLLSKIASSSYKHYNGFDKIVLISSTNPSYSLRLHIWLPQESGFEWENIHDHRWNFSSSVIAGQIFAQYFERTSFSTCSEYDEYCYYPEPNKDSYEMKFSQKQRMRCFLDEKIYKGTTYALDNNVYHRISANNNQISASLMLHGGVIDKQVSVFTLSRDEKFDRILTTRFTPKQLGEKISNLIDVLD